MENNVYSTPKADLVEASATESELASRWSRLGAAFLDTIIISCFSVPLMYFTGGFDSIMEGQQPSFAYSIMLFVAGLVVFLILNGYLLVTAGQTIGKRLIGIKIVTLEGELPNAVRNLLPRYATYMLPGQVPIVGGLFSLVNILFIFGKQKRCIHDYAGNTKVITCT